VRCFTFFIVMIIALVRDLLFVSKITATAKQVGAAVQVVRDPAKIAEHRGSRLIVDLNLPGSIEAAKTWMSKNSHDVVGFVSHTDAQTIADARAAGIECVMARSQFVQSLEELLNGDSEQKNR
jgi:hypothetical protein